MVDTADPVSKLRDLRDSIDNIDAAIVRLLAERFRLLVGVLCCRRPQPLPQNPRLSAPSALTASQFCGHATGVDPHREDAGPIFLVPEGRLYMQPAPSP